MGGQPLVNRDFCGFCASAVETARWPRIVEGEGRGVEVAGRRREKQRSSMRQGAWFAVQQCRKWLSILNAVVHCPGDIQWCLLQLIL